MGNVAPPLPSGKFDPTKWLQSSPNSESASASICSTFLGKIRIFSPVLWWISCVWSYFLRGAGGITISLYAQEIKCMIKNIYNTDVEKNDMLNR